MKVRRFGNSTFPHHAGFLLYVASALAWPSLENCAENHHLSKIAQKIVAVYALWNFILKCLEGHFGDKNFWKHPPSLCLLLCVVSWHVLAHAFGGACACLHVHVCVGAHVFGLRLFLDHHCWQQKGRSLFASVVRVVIGCHCSHVCCSPLGKLP